MNIERGKAFLAHEPEVTVEDVERAKHEGKNVMSFKTKPVLSSTGENVESVAVKFALSDGTTTTVLMDRFVGEALWSLLTNVKRIDWKAV
jgi:hypothetical protein